MKNTVTIAVLILAIFVVAYLLFPEGNVDTEHATRDMPASEPSTSIGDTPESNLPANKAGSQDYSTSSSDRQAPNNSTPSNKGQQLEPEIKNALNQLVNTSHEGLVEEKTDNGVSIDLKGRFRTAPVATINEDGEIVVQDYTSAPGR